MKKLMIFLFLFVSVSFPKELIGTSNEFLNVIVRLIAGTEYNVVTTRNTSIQESQSLDYTPGDDIILLAGTTSAFFYASNSFDDWALDLPATYKINLSEYLEEEDKIFLNDSLLADFWWLDPKIVIDILPKIADTLSKIEPDRAGFFQSNLNISIAKMEVLDAYIQGILKRSKFDPIYEEFPVFMYFAESYNIPYSDFLYYRFGDRDNSFNVGSVESLEIMGTRYFLIHQEKPDKAIKELSLELKFQITSMQAFPSEGEDYYSMMKRIAHQFKKINSN